MILVEINRWISGENAILASYQTPTPSVSADNKFDDEMLIIRPSSRKLEHIGIIGLVGGFASVALVCLALAMRPSVEPSPKADGTPQPSGAKAAFTTPAAAADAGRSTPVTAPSTEAFPTVAVRAQDRPSTVVSDAQLAAPSRPEAAPQPVRKAAIPQRAPRRHWPRYPIHAQVDRGEAARLMADELRQIGVAPVSSLRGVRIDRRRWQAMQRRDSLN